MDPTPKTSLTSYTFNQKCFFWFGCWHLLYGLLIFFAFLFPGSPPKWYHGFAFQDSHGRSAAHIAAALRHKEAATHLAELSNCGKDSFGYTVEKILELGSFGNEIPTVEAAKSGECWQDASRDIEPISHHNVFKLLLEKVMLNCYIYK